MYPINFPCVSVTLNSFKFTEIKILNVETFYSRVKKNFFQKRSEEGRQTRWDTPRQFLETLV